jgi:predicted permease
MVSGRNEELSQELRAFVELDAESKTRSGMTPEEARRAALIEMGGVEQVKEHVREAAAGVRWEIFFRDIRYAMRALVRAPGFSLSVIGNLILGLGAMIVAFAFINGALGPSIIPGIQAQDRLVEIGLLETNRTGTRAAPTALTEYRDVVRVLDEGMPSLEGLASFTESGVAVTLPQPRSLRAAFVSPNYFDVLGVRPEVGRTFASEERGAESPVAIISRALWMREFGGDPSVIGRPIQAGGRQTLEIIGVAPQGFAGTTRPGVDLWLPIGFVNRVAVDDPFGQPGDRLIRYVGRMRDGVRVGRVETELGVAAARLGIARSVGSVPGWGPARLVAGADGSVERVTVEVSGLSRRGVDQLALMIAVILPVPLLVLALACVNAANLLLVRASGRSREVAVRLALGASRSRLVRQLVIESVVLAVGAAIVALPLAWAGVQLIAAFVMLPLPLDWMVVAGAFATAFLTALAFGVVPALHATRQHPSAALGTAPAGSGGTRGEARGRRVLVAGQVALSLGLLAAAFQLTSPLESIAEPPGTDPERLLLASFDLAQLRFSSGESDAFYAALLDRASRLPGAEAAGVSSHDFARGWISDQVRVDTGNGPRDPSGRPFGFLVTASSAEGDFFKVLGLDLRQGREFVATDRRDIPQVAIVTEHFAARVFDGAALGRSFRVSTSLIGEAETEVRIVGIVESPVERNIDNVRGPSIIEPSPSGEVAAIFVPSPLQDGTARTLSVRAGGPAGPLAPAIREIVAQIDPRVPILEMATLDQRIPDITQIIRGLARAAAVLGIVALLLASVGLYGVTSYGVAMRRREIAVRMALGARADRVVAMVLRQALALVTIGAVLGGLIAIAAGGVIQANLFGVPGVNVAALGGSATLLGAAMLLASLLPARRAARLDPMMVLREE